MIEFTQEERMLILLYGPEETREELIRNLMDMKNQLQWDEQALLKLTNELQDKLTRLSDEEFDSIDLFENFDGSEI